MMDAAEAGDKTGVRLARAVHIQAARGLGKNEIMKASIKAFGTALKTLPAAKRVEDSGPNGLRPGAGNFGPDLDGERGASYAISVAW